MDLKTHPASTNSPVPKSLPQSVLITAVAPSQSQHLCLCSGTITKHHRLGAQTTEWFSHSSGARSPRSRCQQVVSSQGLSPGLVNGWLLLMSLQFFLCLCPNLLFLKGRLIGLEPLIFPHFSDLFKGSISKYITFWGQDIDTWIHGRHNSVPN